MEQEELIIYDDAALKKEIEDPLSVEEVPLNDPLDTQLYSETGPQTDVTIKQETNSEWDQRNGVEIEHQEEIINDHHPDDVPADSEVTSYPESQEFEHKSLMAPSVSNHLNSTPPRSPLSPFDPIAPSCRGDPEKSPSSISNMHLDLPKSSMAPFLPSSYFHSPPTRSQFEALALSCHSDAEKPPSSGSTLQMDQDDLSNTSGTHLEPGPEIIFVDTDSENEQRNSQPLASSSSNSESGIWFKAREVSSPKGVNYKLENSKEETVLKQGNIIKANSSKKIKVTKAANKPKRKNLKVVKFPKIPSASQSILATELTKQPLTKSGKTCTVMQNVPSSQQVVEPNQPELSLNQQSLLQNQQTWAPLQQLLALSSQLLSQQQVPSMPSHSSLLMNQLSPKPSGQANTAQSRVLPSNVQKSFLPQSAKKPKLTGLNTSETDARQTTAASQANVNNGNVTTETELLNLKHKIAVQELKIRIRNKKIKAELEESELKLKMEATMQELLNKKLKHDILSAKLQLYTKLCATDKL